MGTLRIRETGKVTQKEKEKLFNLAMSLEKETERIDKKLERLAGLVFDDK